MAANVRFIQNYQYWNDERRNKYHNKKLQQIIQHAYNHVPYYHNMFDKLKLTPFDIQSPSDLQKLPISRKSDILSHINEVKADNFSTYHPIEHHTGGTTGKPFPYYNDRQSWAMNLAIKMVTFLEAGYHYGVDHLGVLAGGSLIPGKNMGWKHMIWRYVNNYYSMPIMHLDANTMDMYYQQIQRQKIQFLRGYPSAVYTFAEYLHQQNYKLSLKAVFTTAENLFPYQREMISNVFQCHVWDTYGCGDGMGNASDCEKHNGMHINDAVSIMQIVDDHGFEVKDEEEGEIVLTSLYDYAFPLIRYAPGDRAIYSKRKCRCGKTLPMIEKIIGRTSDVFRFSNGKIVNAFAFPLEELSHEVEQFQIIQEERDYVRLLLIPEKTFSTKRITQLQDMLHYHCGNDIRVSVEIVDHIDIPLSAKRRFVISKVN